MLGYDLRPNGHFNRVLTPPTMKVRYFHGNPTYKSTNPDASRGAGTGPSPRAPRFRSGRAPRRDSAYGDVASCSGPISTGGNASPLRSSASAASASRGQPRSTGSVGASSTIPAPGSSASRSEPRCSGLRGVFVHIWSAPRCKREPDVRQKEKLRPYIRPRVEGPLPTLVP